MYTELEEKLNYSTHFLGLAFFLIACPYMIVRAIQESKVSIAVIVIYSVGLLAVFTTSSLYHYIKDETLKQKFRTLDHMAIFLLIGGTYTPVVEKYLAPPYAAIFLSILWTLLLVGIFMKYFFTNRFKILSILMYLTLGSAVVIIIDPIRTNMTWDIFKYILYGGITYLVGVLFYINKKQRYTHTIWHLFVLVASIFHYIAIFKIATN